MKAIFSYILVMFFVSAVMAQVQVRPLPVPGYEERIRDHINAMKVVDTHEHLANPAGYANNKALDFVMLLHHYTYDDIRSAGMPKQQFQDLMKDSLPVSEKWNALKPYWEGTNNTAYSRAVLLAVDSLFGVKDINEKTVVELSDKLRNAYKGKWFDHVLKDKCNLEYVVVDGEDRSYGDKKMFRYVKRFDYINIDSRKKIETIEKRQKVGINTLDDLVAALGVEFHTAMKDGFVGVKIGVAYNRILFFDDAKKEKAEEAFNKIKSSSGDIALPFDEVKPLQDYMTHRVIELARSSNVPVQIHTGLQAGDGNIIENSNPTHLANLFLKYRDVNFILFHGGYPFGGELATLAKNFRNVYIDMCWLYIISPSYSKRYLHEWLETVPANKIMAFGGDFHNVEGTYGHLLFAKQIVSNVLCEKVKDGYFTEDEAIKIADMIFCHNAISVLKLNKQ
jgi:uncharacterized protein